MLMEVMEVLILLSMCLNLKVTISRFSSLWNKVFLNLLLRHTSLKEESYPVILLQETKAQAIYPEVSQSSKQKPQAMSPPLCHATIFSTASWFMEVRTPHSSSQPTFPCQVAALINSLTSFCSDPLPPLPPRLFTQIHKTWQSLIDN
jgi:hypothetical protein